MNSQTLPVGIRKESKEQNMAAAAKSPQEPQRLRQKDHCSSWVQDQPEPHSKTPVDVEEEGGGGKEVRRAGEWAFSDADIQSGADLCHSKIFTLDFD